MHVFLRLALLAAACAAWSVPTRAAVVTAGDLARPEGMRHYLLATPTRAAGGKRPLVILFHGHMGSARQVFGSEGFNSPLQQWLAIADRAQVLVIAPDGVKGSDDKSGWNDCRADARTNPHVDDVGFVGALIDKAVADYGADPARVYAMGTSNGGAMVFRLATEMAPRLAAFATVAGPWPAHSRCAPPRQALPALIVHGSADPIVPYAGGEIGNFLLRGRGTALGVDATVAIWRQLAGLQGAPLQAALAHRDASGATSVTRAVWGADPHGLQVEFLKIEGGGHTEPSIAHRMPGVWSLLLGKQNGDLEIAEEAWRFFTDKRAAHAP